MNLSITSDFAKDIGNPEPYLRGIAEAGFTHIHWCHHWHTDFVYSKPEIDQIRSWLNEYNLQVLDLHASAGQEKRWSSTVEFERLAGVELVRNRIEMAAALGADVIVMHPGTPRAGNENAFWKSLRASLDALRPVALSHGVRIAVENGDWPVIERILSDYPENYVGLCYDSGHANIGFGSIDLLESVKSRLLCLHLHDNDGTGDQHKLPFTGTVDWAKLTRVIASSAYSKCVSLEVSMRNAGIGDENEFLRRAHGAGTQLTQMLTTLKRA